jgi:probable HAF family extracellular repeat protein
MSFRVRSIYLFLHRRVLTLSLIAGLAMLSTQSQAHPVTSWAIVDLGTLGGTYSEARDINDRGQITGVSTTAGDNVRHAFIYKNGVMQDISNTSSGINTGMGINFWGNIVGFGSKFEGDLPFPFIFKNGSMTFLEKASGRAWDINNLGGVVGEALIGPNNENRAFFYKDGSMKDLGTLGGSSSSATAINNFWQIVGNSALSGDATYHAFLYRIGGMKDLGTLGGTFSIAYGINDKGQVVGESTVATTGSVSHAFLYAGKMRDLGTLGGSFSRALGINYEGHVVGMSDTADDPAVHAFLYNGVGMIDLNALPEVKKAGWFLSAAYAINNLGQIVGTGTIHGAIHGFLLIPRRNECDNGKPHDPKLKHDCDPRVVPFSK